MKKPFRVYPGGKNGDGTYQAIINQLPPHKMFISGFAGNCGVTANKAPASAIMVIDLDIGVIQGWDKVFAANNYTNAGWTVGDCMKAIPAMQIRGGWALSEHTIQVYSNDETLIYLDPPYLIDARKHKRKIYKHGAIDTAWHTNFLAWAKTLPCMVAISHYPCSLYNEALSDWRCLKFKSKTRTGMAIEALYMNYQVPDRLHDYSYLGKDYREREANKRAAVNLVNKFKRMPPQKRNFFINTIQKNFL